MIQVDGRELRLVLSDLERRGRGLSRLMPAVGEALVSAVSDVYDAEGPGWTPLAASTIRRRRGSSAKILQDTSRMSSSTHRQHGHDWAEAYAGVFYAEFHSTGTRTMPRRDPFDLGPFLAPLLDEVAAMFATEATR